MWGHVPCVTAALARLAPPLSPHVHRRPHIHSHTHLTTQGAQGRPRPHGPIPCTPVSLPILLSECEHPPPVSPASPALRVSHGAGHPAASSRVTRMAHVPLPGQCLSRGPSPRPLPRVYARRYGGREGPRHQEGPHRSQPDSSLQTGLQGGFTRAAPWRHDSSNGFSHRGPSPRTALPFLPLMHARADFRRPAPTPEGAFLCRLESLPRFPALCSGSPSAHEARARYK